ncbi:hypothetical protein SLS62_001623 [Diatrype stigma]|uniref:Uncharacterized protein n=1 Tax=Diatrype stigma TaxID=117547 RepID=A0AAN9V0N5_9PEZI
MPRCCEFAKPARFVARDKLRTAFREKDAKLDVRGVLRTVRFLEAAARERGLEHAVLKNILLTSYFRHHFIRHGYNYYQALEKAKKSK